MTRGEPAPVLGLADPVNPTRLHPGIKLLFAMGTRHVKVRFTEDARRARGPQGSPEPVRVMRLMRFVEQAHADALLVKHRRRGETVVRPDEVELVDSQVAVTHSSAGQPPRTSVPSGSPIPSL